MYIYIYMYILMQKSMNHCGIVVEDTAIIKDYMGSQHDLFF